MMMGGEKMRTVQLRMTKEYGITSFKYNGIEYTTPVDLVVQNGDTIKLTVSVKDDSVWNRVAFVKDGKTIAKGSGRPSTSCAIVIEADCTITTQRTTEESGWPIYNVIITTTYKGAKQC
jgi:hypothetical protein